ncbi:M20 family metallopeptidase [Paenibacillus koleovorans]|uniref:M20 family metallopeptidase n=1 Tax=Paenibacillus koleovorans TaxID=121608 RepID=UPI000FD7F000|nr:ArgE/DapE family deacylase [Paenibacillus koleovorans]
MEHQDRLVWKTKATTAIESRREELLELVSALIRFPSENPPGNSYPITRFIADYLGEAGIQCEWHEATPGMWNLVARTSGGGPSPSSSPGSSSNTNLSMGTSATHGIGTASPPRRLIFCGHTDVVPAGDLARWPFDPYAGLRDDEWIYGRGATDMKAGLAGLLYAAVTLKREGVPLDGDLIVAVVPDEETGGRWGIPWLLERGLLAGDGCIIAEPAFPYHPTIGQKGCIRLRLKLRGQPAHSALAPLLGRNAIASAALAMQAIAAAAELPVHLPAAMQPLMERSKQFLDEFGFRAESMILDRIAFNVGTIRGGTSVNVVPDYCELEADMRIPVGLAREQVLEAVKRRLEPLGPDVEIELFGIQSEPNWTDPDDSVCRTLTSNIEWLTGQPSYGVLQWAASDARHFREYGIPVLQYGPADLSTIHQYGERAPVKDTVRAAQVFAATAIDYLNGG